VTGVLAGLDVVFIAVPGTNDVRVVSVVLKHPHRTVCFYRLHNAFHDPALTHRSAAMSALIVPGMKLTIDHENPNLGVATFEQQAPALFELIDPAGTVFGHGILNRDTILDEQDY
jgi:hypothetical protein